MNERNTATDEVLVLGAGLAGSFAARALADAGWPVRVVDRQPVGEDGPAAYAPRVALLQPKISDIGDKPGHWLREGAELARTMIESRWPDDPRVAWRRCGALHVAHDERSRRRLTRYLDQFGGDGGLRWIDAGQTQAEVGVALGYPGLLLELTGVVRPAGLCSALLRHPRIVVRGGRAVAQLRQTGQGWSAVFEDGCVADAPRVVVANAVDAQSLEPTSHLGLQPIRGQVSCLPAQVLHRLLHLNAGTEVRRAICFGGYLMPEVAGQYTLGASFIPGDANAEWRDEEAQSIWARLGGILEDTPVWPEEVGLPTGWAGIRCATPTRLAYAGPVDRDGNALPGLYASLGHGSHGIASAARSARQIVETIA